MKIASTVEAHGHLEIISFDAKTGEEVWRSPVIANKILNAALSLIVQHNGGTAATSMQITSLEIGTGSTAVTASDTALVTPILTGVTVTETAVSAASVQFDFFIVDAALANGTYREIMLRAATVPYTRALFTTPYVKTTGRNTLIRYTLSYASV